MPTAESILSWAAAVANEWRWLAVAWHGALAVLMAAVLTGRRPTERLVGYLLVATFVSVGIIAAISGSPFNAAVFALLAIALTRVARGWSHRSIHFASAPWLLAGVALTAFGWTYPHFVAADGWITYLYASPLGLLPCPTLSVVIGITLIVDGLRSRMWSVILVAAGVVYGVIGVYRLDVSLDAGLLAGAAVLAAAVASGRSADPERQPMRRVTAQRLRMAP